MQWTPIDCRDHRLGSRLKPVPTHMSGVDFQLYFVHLCRYVRQASSPLWHKVRQNHALRHRLHGVLHGEEGVEPPASLPHAEAADDNDPSSILASLPADDAVVFNDSELDKVENLLGNIVNVCYLRCAAVDQGKHSADCESAVSAPCNRALGLSTVLRLTCTWCIHISRALGEPLALSVQVDDCKMLGTAQMNSHDTHLDHTDSGCTWAPSAFIHGIDAVAMCASLSRHADLLACSCNLSPLSTMWCASFAKLLG